MEEFDIVVEIYAELTEEQREQTEVYKTQMEAFGFRVYVGAPRPRP